MHYACATRTMRRLDDHVGLHPGLGGVKPLLDAGQVAVVQGVGYPNPDRSHFEAMDIWQTAEPAAYAKSGWLGRYLAGCQCGAGSRFRQKAESESCELECMLASHIGHGQRVLPEYQSHRARR